MNDTRNGGRHSLEIAGAEHKAGRAYGNATFELSFEFD